MSNKNPYGQAAGAYGSATNAAETDQRMIEARALLKAASRLDELSKKLAGGENISLEDIDDSITNNRKLWTVFLSESMNAENSLPQDIKNNISSLAMFVFKRSTQVLIDPTPEKIKVMIDINRNIASGLMKQAKQSPEAPAETTPQKADSFA